jgi:tRNA pseudouridine55 synthase
VTRPPRETEPSGILVVDKESGVTSFDVVAAARRALGMRRIGHAGTLDPGATGVLPLLLGEATKLMPYLVDQDKEYRATIRLGVTTDTQDLAGRIVATAPVPPLTVARVEQAVRPFVGAIRQVPPMFSALRHGGRRLHELAREGREVERPPREVLVHSIAVEALASPAVTLRIVCGKGTYIRVIAADLGAALGCGGSIEHLARLRVGPFALADAVPSAALRAAARETLLARVLPPDAALAGWPVARLDARDAAAFLHGQHVALSRPEPGSRFVRVRDSSDTFLGVGRVFAGGARVRPERIVHADRPGTRILPA